MVNRWYVTPPRKHRPEKVCKSDPQRHDVSRMEGELIGMAVNTFMCNEHLNEVAKHACKFYHVKPPTLTSYKFNSPDYFADCGDGVIRLNVNSDHSHNIFTLLHELAHHIIQCKNFIVHDHGPEWMSVYATLMAKYKMMPRDCVLLLASRYGVEVGDEI